ncbi:hypothetical protein DH2020_016149 [Rehmannia glutinosa]|uniref:Exonuclease domain-containing protein n=1 Tax=Rehmannia glutinosa TaxID=99300 RepID=A0ABR0WUP7_REHGL
MDELIDSTKKEVLVEMVKLAQKRGMAGCKGGWKDFLKVYDKKFGASLSDPSRRSVDSLAAFLKTFEQDDDLKFFKKLLQCHSNRTEVEQFKKISPDKETAEQRLVRLTLEHPQYPIDYSFPSHEEEWAVIKCSKKSKVMKSTKMLAIDCEMVLCEDGTEALVKVCAVNRNLQVKLDEVVNPNKAIADYRTEITGISAKDLDGVTRSLKDVQESLKKLLSHGTILVGHSANNDLRDHTRVIDTSYLFKYANGPINRKPSLSLLCKKGSPHNCLDDACAAMKLVLARLEGKIDDVIAEEVQELDMAKLLVHRIPVNILTKDLKSVLTGDCTIEAKVSKKAKDTYSAFAIFKNQQEAIEAFDNLEGDLEKVSKKRSVEEDTPGILKKLKTDQTSEELEDSIQCETHLKEIERLKAELNQRDQEISNLNKIIAALARKQGL